MGQDLKAENLTISVPNIGCDKNCPYCVSKMTGYLEPNPQLINRNLKTALHLAKQAEITSVMITGKGEPTLDLEFLFDLIKEIKFIHHFPVELQTNGIKLSKKLDNLNRLFACGLNVLALSIDSVNQLIDYKKILEVSHGLGLITRITINVTDLFFGAEFNSLIAFCNINKINQLTFRKIIAPNKPKDEKVAEWIRRNAPEKRYNEFIDKAKVALENRGKLIRRLNNGVNIYDIDGIAFSYSDYCIQESNEGDNIRSLIFQEDGHLYTSWNSQASILF